MTNIKIDLHLHSKFSTRPSSWILQKTGCQESYTSPIDLYKKAKEKGMDYVTITDHNRIDGAIEIAHLPDTFISEEITTYFPEDGCKIHVLAWNINENNHHEISKARKNIFDLSLYLNENKIVHGVAHPLYSINNKLTINHFEQLLILFSNFELNGTRDFIQNQILSNILCSLTPKYMEEIQNKHNLKAFYERSWIKKTTGGSDDHSSLNIASKYTQITNAQNLNSFFNALKPYSQDLDSEVLAMGKNSSPTAMAHNLYSIIYQFYKSRVNLDKYFYNDPTYLKLDQILTGIKTNEIKQSKIKQFFYSRRKKAEFKNSFFEKAILKEASKIIIPENGLKDESNAASVPSDTELLFNYINKVSEQISKKSADKLFRNILKGNFFDVFQFLSSAGSLYTMLSPYFISYGLFTKDRDFCMECQNKLLNKNKQSIQPKPSVAYFTDTFLEVNGVAKTLGEQLELSRELQLQMEIITCQHDESQSDADIVYFKPIGSFSIPSYEEICISYPPFLKILDYCYKKNFSHIHAVTPGSMGLAALAAAKILKKPVCGTYHTSFPQYIKELTNDDSLEELTWKYMSWFYNQMDMVYVPSHAVEKELIEKGINPKKIIFYPRGTDINKFSPEKQDPITEFKYKIPSGKIKILYAGRVSKEKNIDDIIMVYKNLLSQNFNCHLIICGDGPYMNTTKAMLSNVPVTFTGFINTDELSYIYASSDVLLFPSQTDTFGNVVLEAQASGIPVIVSDKGGPSENIINEKTGIIVPAGNIEAFTDAVLKICKNQLTLNLMKKNARRYMETRSFETAHKELWEIYSLTNTKKTAA